MLICQLENRSSRSDYPSKRFLSNRLAELPKGPIPSNVIRSQTATDRQAGPDRRVLPHHVLVGMFGVVPKHIHLT